MFSALGVSSSNNQWRNSPNYLNTWGIRKSYSNNHLNTSLSSYYDKNNTKHTSSYALYDTSTIATDRLDHNGLRCHHSSTTNLSKIKPQIFDSTNKQGLSDQNRHSDSSSDNNKKEHSNNSLIDNSVQVKTNSYREFGISKPLKKFFSCSRPCGFLTATIGTFLFILSSLFFVIFFDKNICDEYKVCNKSLSWLNIGMVSALVIGFFMSAIGATIIVYIKKDVTGKVIVLDSKGFMYEANKEDHFKNNTPHNHVQEDVNPHGHGTHNSHFNSEKIAEKTPLKAEEITEIDMNEYNYDNLSDKANSQTSPVMDKSSDIVISINDQEVK